MPPGAPPEALHADHQLAPLPLRSSLGVCPTTWLSPAFGDYRQHIPLSAGLSVTLSVTEGRGTRPLGACHWPAAVSLGCRPAPGVLSGTGRAPGELSAPDPLHFH